MYLVDTSAWIRHFSKKDSFDLRSICGPDDRVLCPPVYQEIFQGIREDAVLQDLKSILGAAEMVENPMTLDVWAEAADLHRVARRRGLTIRSSVDCLVAVCALRHRLTVVHHDRDYEALAQVSALKTLQVG